MEEKERSARHVLNERTIGVVDDELKIQLLEYIVLALEDVRRVVGKVQH